MEVKGKVIRVTSKRLHENQFHDILNCRIFFGTRLLIYDHSSSQADTEGGGGGHNSIIII